MFQDHPGRGHYLQSNSALWVAERKVVDYRRDLRRCGQEYGPADHRNLREYVSSDPEEPISCDSLYLKTLLAFLFRGILWMMVSTSASRAPFPLVSVNSVNAR